MSIEKMQKEELELMSHKDITNLLLSEYGVMNTKDLFKKIVELLELPKSALEDKIADYYMALTTDKRFIMLADGKWDLRNRHTSDKVSNDLEEDEEEIEEESSDTKEDALDEDANDYESDSDYDDNSDNEDLKDLIVIDEDELELEE